MNEAPERLPELLVCTSAINFDGGPGGTSVVVHEGAILRLDHPAVKGREHAFSPLCLVAYGDADLPLTVAVVKVVGDTGSGYQRYLKVPVFTPDPPDLTGG